MYCNNFYVAWCIVWLIVCVHVSAVVTLLDNGAGNADHTYDSEFCSISEVLLGVLSYAPRRTEWIPKKKKSHLA
jgi:hypothetical protein